MSTFREFTAGLQAGQELRKTRETGEAQAKASALFGAGDYQGAETALYGAGMYAEGSALAGAGARRKEEARVKTYGDAFKTGGYKAVRDAAGAEGDIGMAGQMDATISAMSAEERQNALQRVGFLGNAAYGLAQIKDPAQRQQAFMELVETQGQAYGITPEQAAAFDLSDTNLQQVYENTLSVAERLSMKRQEERWGVEDGFQERGLDLQERSVRAAERAEQLKLEMLKNPPADIKDEASMRNQFLGQVKGFGETREAYARVVSTADTPAGDLVLLYSIMKMVDPGASVMEGDLANAKNASAVPDQIRNAYNAVILGRGITPEARADYQGQAQDLYETAETGYLATSEIWREIAAGSGLDPNRVVPEQRLYDFDAAPRGGKRGGGGKDGGARPSLGDIFAPSPGRD